MKGILQVKGVIQDHPSEAASLVTNAVLKMRSARFDLANAFFVARQSGEKSYATRINKLATRLDRCFKEVK